MDSSDSGQNASRKRQCATSGKRTPKPAGRGWKGLITVGALVLVLGILAWATRQQWLPHLREAMAHAGDDSHLHAAGEDAPAIESRGEEVSFIELSEQGRKNIGLTLETVALSDFDRTISIPATLVERPGQTQIIVSAPMTGIVTGIHPIRGEAVTPGAPLFDLRLTHEDLVEKQSSLLQSLEELDVVEREVARLKDVTATGAVAGKRLLEQEYEKSKIEASIRAARQALLLHGLSEAQIQKIVNERQLQQNLTISAPELNEHTVAEQHDDFLQVAEIAVNVGEHVQTGVPLATLTDHCELYVEGKAFEQDSDALNRVARENVEVTAIIEGNGSGDRLVEGLQILHVENAVERESRALKFYVLLPNELVRNEVTSGGHRFIGWRYKPGQRVEVRIPVERWQRRIVLPVEAVIEEGPERYVYQETRGGFQRRPVHVEYRGQRMAVIESDGTLFPGDKVAARGAYQIHLALKNKAGGGPDPHAGHHH